MAPILENEFYTKLHILFLYFYSARGALSFAVDKDGKKFFEMSAMK